MTEHRTVAKDVDRVEFTADQIDRLGHWLSECLDDAAPLNERIWRSRAAWMVTGPTFQGVLREVVEARVLPPSPQARRPTSSVTPCTS